MNRLDTFARTLTVAYGSTEDPVGALVTVTTRQGGMYIGRFISADHNWLTLQDPDDSGETDICTADVTSVDRVHN